ncbi:MAG: aspartate carbamoyltransferase [Candidatus Ranarchaeia archaeon]
MSFAGRDLITLQDFSDEEILAILNTAKTMRPYATRKKRSRLLDGWVLATIFFEPSTRTRMSFASAMYRLGGNVLEIGNTKQSSVAKGESLADTLRTIEQYCDIMVLRHPKMGAAKFAAGLISKPVINAGDGSGLHPTQTLLDLFTIWEKHEDLSDLKIAIMGDLKYGRTTHSLSTTLARFTKSIYLISPDSLRMPREYIDELAKQKVKVVETAKVESILPELDVLYVTRIQKERFPDPSEYQKVADIYKVDAQLLKKSKPELMIMHPLPRVGEIDYDVDDLPKAKYFEQMFNGILVRMALLTLIAGVI